jgi:hypothetical protein
MHIQEIGWRQCVISEDDSAICDWLRPLYFPGCAPAGSEIGEGDGLLQYVEHRDQECVRDGYGGLLCGHVRLQLVELVA